MCNSDFLVAGALLMGYKRPVAVTNRGEMFHSIYAQSFNSPFLRNLHNVSKRYILLIKK